MSRLVSSPRQELKPTDLFQISLIIMLSNKRIDLYAWHSEKLNLEN